MEQKITKLYIDSEYDDQCRNELVNLLSTRFCSFFRKLGADHYEAEDYCQEFFLILFYKARATFDPERAFKPWAYMIARNLYYRQTRKKRHVNIISMQEWMTEKNKNQCQSSFETHSDNKIYSRSLLDKLSYEKRRVIELKHFHGLKFSEIAEELNISEGTIKSRLYSALLELKQKAEGMEL